MATLRKRKTKAGFSYQVRWRDRESSEETSRTFDSLKEAKIFKDFLNANNQSLKLATKSAEQLKSHAPSISEVIELHLKTLIHVQADTFRDYELICEKHIIPELGNIPVDRFTHEDAREWFMKLDVAYKTKKNIQSIFSAALKTAVEKNLIQANVVAGLKAPRELLNTEPIYLSVEESQQLIDACPEAFRLLIEFLLVSGLRWGEATALQRKDLRMKNEQLVVSVTKAWKKSPGGTKIGVPKTRASVRSVSLPVGFSDKLRLWVADCHPSDLIFPNPGTGKTLSNKTFHAQAWKPALAKCNFFENPRVHDLRHTHASRLLELGANMHVLQKRLGHGSITTTVNTYGHLSIQADGEVAQLLEK